MAQDEDNWNRIKLLVEDNEITSLEDELRSCPFSTSILNRALHLAACKAHPTCLSVLLEGGADVQWKDDMDRNVLHLVMWYGMGNVEVIKAVLHSIKQPSARKDFVNTHHGSGKTPLYYAAEAGFTDAVELLLTEGAEVDRVPPGSHVTPLMAAASGGHVLTVRMLLSHNADVSNTDIYQTSALIRAVESNQADVVELLIESGADIDEKDSGEKTLLMVAAENNAVEAADVLIKHGALVNQKYEGNRRGIIRSYGLPNKEDEYQYRSLCFAVAKQNARMVDFLLSKGAHCNILYKDRIRFKSDLIVSPFLMAVYLGYVDTAKMLLNAGADIHQYYVEHGFSNSGMRTNGNALHLACHCKNEESLKYLLEPQFVFDLDEPDGRGAIPFILCCENHYGELIRINNFKILLQNGANPDFSSKGEKTALSYAIKHFFYEIVRILIRYGCDVNKLAVAGCYESEQLPLEIAVRLGSAWIVRALWQAGSELGQTSVWASTCKVPYYEKNDLGFRISDSNKNAVATLLDQITESPRSLAQLAVLAVRSQLGRNIESKLDGLGLPETLKADVNLPCLDFPEDDFSDSSSDSSEDDIF